MVRRGKAEFSTCQLISGRSPTSLRRSSYWDSEPTIRSHQASGLTHALSASVALWMPTLCAGWVYSCTPARHRDRTPPRHLEYLFNLGGGHLSIQPSLLSTTFPPSRKWSQPSLLSFLCLLISRVTLPTGWFRPSLLRRSLQVPIKTLGF